MPRRLCCWEISSCTAWSISNFSGSVRSSHRQRDRARRMIELIPIVVPVLSFAAIATAVFVVGHYLSAQARVRRRLAVPSQTSDIAVGSAFHDLHAFIGR